MAKLRLMKTGHGDLVLAEWEPSSSATVNRAESIFRDEIGQGRMAFRLDGPGQTTPIKDFDKSAPEILLVPPITGG